MPAALPVTVFTGFLGAGKTTLILALLKRLPPGYKVVVLKNEFGDVKVDSALAKNSNVEIQEMMNGCLCCVLVGQMKNALQELQEKYAPDRVIIETSGSAFPGPIAWQLRDMASEGFVLDAILTVVDCENFVGYEDTSYTAKMQARYSDIILLNKYEHVSERQMDDVIDRVNDLNDETPRIHVPAGEGPDPDVVFGIDTQLFLHTDKGAEILDEKHHEREIDLLRLEAPPGTVLDPGAIETALKALGGEDVYRVKGFFWSDDAPLLINGAFGRSTFTPLSDEEANEASMERYGVRISVMGLELARHAPTLRQIFSIKDDAGVHLHPRSDPHTE